MKQGEASLARANCLHCGLPFHGAGQFCCGGCETIYSLFKEKGWSEFYRIRDTSPSLGVRRRPIASGKNYSFLNESENSEMEFFLEGIHCISCLWLLERLPELLEGVKQARLNMGTSILRVSIDRNVTAFSPVAELLDKLGYPPSPVQPEGPSRKSENRRFLFRIGVAAVCAGNIMLLAFAQYAGLSGWGGKLFAWLSAALAVPVLGYAATPFYIETIRALRAGRLSIDFPIVLALLAGAVASVVNLWNGSDAVYFDSVSLLVFLLLSSRYLLRRMQEAQFRASPLLSYLHSNLVRKKSARGTEPISLAKVRIGDTLLVNAGEKIPADGILRTGRAHVDMKLLTGESLPVAHLAGDTLLAGTTNLASPIEIEVTAIGNETRLGDILGRVSAEGALRTPLAEFSDRVGRRFTLLVSLLAAGTFLWFLPDSAQGANRALALVIVACPCVLAFAIPFVGTLSLRRLSQEGIFVKNAAALEALNSVRHVVFDKTGTLTQGLFQVNRWLSEPGDAGKSAALSLEWKSSHPVAKALVRFIQAENLALAPLEVADFRETTGSGVSGKIGGDFYEVRKIPLDSAENNIGVFRNKKLIARVSLGDALRPEAPSVVGFLRERGIETSLLSGDTEAATKYAARQAGIPQAIGNLSPEDKAELLKAIPNAAMVGDGANDAIALAAARVGIATEGSMEIALRSSDIYIGRRGLAPLISLFKAADLYQTTIRRNLLVSASYNSLGALLAIMGLIHPLVAAVLMPLSSLSVFAFTLWQFRGRQS